MSEDENQFSVLNSSGKGPYSALKRIVELGENAVRVELSEGQSIAILGICTVWVRIGEITVLGARLQASPRVHRLYAPATLALPQIAAWSEKVELVLGSTGGDLLDLHDSPESSIWDVPGQQSSAERSFHIVSVANRQLLAINLIDGTVGLLLAIQ